MRRYFGRDEAPAGVDVSADIRVLQQEISALQAEMDDVEDLRSQCRECESDAAAATVEIQTTSASSTSVGADRSVGRSDITPRSATSAELRRDRAIARGASRPGWETYSQPSRHDPPAPRVSPPPRRPYEKSETADAAIGARVKSLNESSASSRARPSTSSSSTRSDDAQFKPKAKTAARGTTKFTTDKTLVVLPKSVAVRLRHMVKPTTDGVHVWLDENSHVALRLTVADALAATAIRRQGTYVQSIRKYVYPRVFDDAFSHCRVLDTSKTEGGEVSRLVDWTSGSSSSSTQPELLYVALFDPTPVPCSCLSLKVERLPVWACCSLAPLYLINVNRAARMAPADMCFRKQRISKRTILR